MAKNVTKNMIRLIHLPAEVRIDRIETHAHSYELFISFPPPPRVCPHCASADCVIKDSGRPVTVRHSPFSGSGILVSFHQRRLSCKACRSSFYDRPYWLHPSLHMTMDLYLRICRGLCSIRAISDIAKDCCVSSAIVRSVMEHVEFPVPSMLPETLCIDEFKGSSGSWDPEKERWSVEKFHTNIADGDIGSVFDILRETDLNSLSAYFSAFSLSSRKMVKYFCCDMHGGYISLAKRAFPDAVICIDMFHVVRLLNDNVDDIRRSLQKQLREDGREEEYAMLKHSCHILRTAEANQIDLWGDRLESKRLRLETILGFSDDLREAYDALQAFHSILRMSLFGLRRESLSEWIRTYSSSECPGTRRCVNTIRHYRSYIQNSWKYHKSNGTCEGLNKRIKDIKRNEYGAHSFPCFRRRILFACGFIKFVEESFTISAEKNPRHRKEDVSNET